MWNKDLLFKNKYYIEHELLLLLYSALPSPKTIIIWTTAVWLLSVCQHYIKRNRCRYMLFDVYEHLYNYNVLTKKKIKFILKVK